MIRLRIEKNPDVYAELEGIQWYKDGLPVGRVIIEQEIIVSEIEDEKRVRYETWLPVEVIDEQV